MPGTIVDDVDLIDAGRGGGAPPPAGGDDDGDSSRLEVGPARASSTIYGPSTGLAAIVMFFMALASSYIVRKGLGVDWQSTPLPPVLWFNTAILLASSVTIVVARKKLEGGEREAFRSWWWVTTGLGLLFLAGQIIAWRQLAASGNVARNQSQQQLLLPFDRRTRRAPGRRDSGLFYVMFRPWSRSRISQSTAAELASIYWHFMDGLWIFLLALLTLGR